MEDRLHLLQATNAHLDRIRELHLAGLRDTGALSPDPRLDADLADVEAAYADGVFLLAAWAAEPHRIVGMGALAHGDGGWQVKRMRVEASQRRRGVGRAILRRLLARARECGIAELTLDTARSQGDARRLYEAHGFVRERDVVIGGIASHLYRLRPG